MPLIMRTNPDDQFDHDIAQAGRLGARGVGGIPVDRAAIHMYELQNEDGSPLKGKALENAVRVFAEKRGFVVQKVSDQKEMDSIVAELGGIAAPDLAAVVVAEQDKIKREQEAAALMMPEVFDDDTQGELEVQAAKEAAKAAEAADSDKVEDSDGDSDETSSAGRKRRA